MTVPSFSQLCAVFRRKQNDFVCSYFVVQTVMSHKNRLKLIIEPGSDTIELNVFSQYSSTTVL